MRRLKLIILITAFASLASAKPTEKLFKSTKNNEYYIEPDNKYTWQDSWELCKNLNKELLTIETLEKSQEIDELLMKVFTGKSIPKMYIGANDLKESRKFNWTSSDDKAFDFTNWEPHEPNNYHKLNERCVHIGFHGNSKWNDINCSRKYGFICQKVDYDKLIRLGPRV